MEVIKQPFTNVQLEILKAFFRNLSDEDLIEFRRTIAMFFAERATAATDKVWEEKGWTDADVERMLNTKMRKSKK